MYGATTSDDYRPLTWFGKYPVDVTTLLVAVHVALLIVACFLVAFGFGGILDLLAFDSAGVLAQGRVWQLASYAFVHSPYSPTAMLWFAVEMYMLYGFGREVERFIGRRAFITLYALLVLVPTALLTLAGFWMRVGISGSGVLHLGIFLAFATIYPSVEMTLLRVPMKWIAFILIAIGTLFAFAVHDWGSLMILWTTAAIAYLFMRSRGVGGDLEWWEDLKTRLQPKPKFTVVPRVNPRRIPEAEDIDSLVDPLLEKISKSGINSLTASERRTLDRARNQLLKQSE